MNIKVSLFLLGILLQDLFCLLLGLPDLLIEVILPVLSRFYIVFIDCGCFSLLFLLGLMGTAG